MPVGDFYEERESPEVCIFFLSTAHFIFFFSHSRIWKKMKSVGDILGTDHFPHYVAGYEVGALGQRGGSINDHGHHWPARSTSKP